MPEMPAGSPECTSPQYRVARFTRYIERRMDHHAHPTAPETLSDFCEAKASLSHLRLSRFKLARPPTPRDTEASNASAVIHDSRGPVCLCSLIGINSSDNQVPGGHAALL